MDFLKFLLYIIIFLVSLTVLIVFHELGHLSMAKLFKVYCFEFSIGMGPALYQKKPKKEKGQETAFSVRAFPIGGYVAMAGEDMEDAAETDPELVVDKERTIEGKPRWQRIIIMAAGVFMNFVIGYIIFALDFTCCTQKTYLSDSNVIQVYDDTLASKAGLVSGDAITGIKEQFYYLDSNGNLDKSTNYIINADDITLYSYSETPEHYTDYNHAVSTILSGYFYNTDAEDGYVYYAPKTEGDQRVVTLTYTHDGAVKTVEITTEAISSKAYFFSNSSLSWGTLGIGTQVNYYRYSFVDGMRVAGKTWTTGCGQVVKGLASLFTPEGWKNVGGIVATFEISTVAAENGIASYLYLWGLLSVNLGIVNLFPIPGLDGWQILITLIEQVFILFKKGVRKIKGDAKEKNMSEEEKQAYEKALQDTDFKKGKTYKKVKQIMSMVGLGLIIVLAVLLVIKDIIFPVI